MSALAQKCAVNQDGKIMNALIVVSGSLVIRTVTVEATIAATTYVARAVQDTIVLLIPTVVVTMNIVVTILVRQAPADGRVGLSL